MLPAGPKIRGEWAFDNHCVYGNDMLLTDGMMNFLNYWCVEGGEDDKYYLYRMTKSAVMRKGSEEHTS